MFQWLLKKVVGKTKRKKRDSSLYFSLGAKKDLQDRRDYTFSYAPGVSQLPEEYEIPALPPIRNQGSIGACASFAAVGAVEIQLLNKNPRRFLEGSELYHYYNTRLYVNKELPLDGGQSIRDACKCLDKYHMALEYAWPYNPSRFNEEPPFWAYMVSGAYKIERYERLVNIEQVKEALSRNMPVMFGLELKNSFRNLNAKNPIYIPTDGVWGNHAMLLVGYSNLKKTFTVRNCWGPGWGLNGYCKVSYDTFLKDSFDWWIVEIKG